MTLIYSPEPPTLDARIALAPRLRSLEGARIGILDNSKANAGDLLSGVRTALIERYGAIAGTSQRKGSAGKAASADVLETLVATCDLVLTGSADCGSCTSASVQDTIALESLQMPTVLLGTDAFEPLARQLAGWLNLPDLELAATPHPLGGIREDEVAAKAEALAEAVARLASPA